MVAIGWDIGEYMELNPEFNESLDVTVCKGGLIELTWPTPLLPTVFSARLGAPFVLFVGTLEAAAGAESLVVLLLFELGV